MLVTKRVNGTSPAYVEFIQTEPTVARCWPTPANSGDQPNVGFQGVERKSRQRGATDADDPKQS